MCSKVNKVWQQFLSSTRVEYDMKDKGNSLIMGFYKLSIDKFTIGKFHPDITESLLLTFGYELWFKFFLILYCFYWNLDTILFYFLEM